MKKLYYLGIPLVFLFGFFYGLFAGFLTGIRISSDRIAGVVASQKNFPNFYNKSFEFAMGNESIASKRKPLFFIDFLATLLLCVPLTLFLIVRCVVLGPVYLNRTFMQKIFG